MQLEQLYFQKLSELSDEEYKKIQLTPFVCRMVLFVSLLGAIGLGLVAYPIIQFFFGRSYIDAFIPLIFLLPGILVFSGCRVLSNDLASRGKPELNLYATILMTLINVTLNLILIPKYSIVGAAIATSIAYVFCFFYIMITYCRLTKQSPVEVLFISAADIRSAIAAMRQWMQ